MDKARMLRSGHEWIGRQVLFVGLLVVKCMAGRAAYVLFAFIRMVQLQVIRQVMEREVYGTVIGWFPSPKDYAALRCTMVIFICCRACSPLSEFFACSSKTRCDLTVPMCISKNLQASPGSTEPQSDGGTDPNTITEDSGTYSTPVKASSSCVSSTTSAEEPKGTASGNAAGREELKRAMAQLLGLPPAFCSAVLTRFGWNRQKAVDFVVAARPEEVNSYCIPVASPETHNWYQLRPADTCNPGTDLKFRLSG